MEHTVQRSLSETMTILVSFESSVSQVQFYWMVISFESATNCKKYKGGFKAKNANSLFAVDFWQRDSFRCIMWRPQLPGLVCCERPKCREKSVWKCLKKDKTNSYLPDWRQQIKRKPQESKVVKQIMKCLHKVPQMRKLSLGKQWGWGAIQGSGDLRAIQEWLIVNVEHLNN